MRPNDDRIQEPASPHSFRDCLPVSLFERETFPSFCVFPAALLLWLLLAFWPGIPQIPRSALALCLNLPRAASLAQGLLPPEVCRAPAPTTKPGSQQRPRSQSNACCLSCSLPTQSCYRIVRTLRVLVIKHGSYSSSCTREVKSGRSVLGTGMWLMILLTWEKGSGSGSDLCQHPDPNRHWAVAKQRS